MHIRQWQEYRLFVGVHDDGLVHVLSLRRVVDLSTRKQRAQIFGQARTFGDERAVVPL
jgi:hypothetical protein